MTMGKTKEKPKTDDRQILTDSTGKPTHVVLTVEAFQDMEELIEDLQTFQEFRENRDTEEFLPLAEVKKSLGL
jgi:hypothetical protein